MRGSSVAPSGSTASSGDADAGNTDAHAGASSGDDDSSAAGTDHGGVGGDGSAAGPAGGGALNVGSNAGVSGEGSSAGRNSAGDGAGGTSGGDARGAGAGGVTASGGATNDGKGGASGGTGGKSGIGCGNGLIENGEACDDANQTAADGCSPTCKLEGGFACAGTPSSCSTHLSCIGMRKTCGASGIADCCGASRVTGGTFNRRHNPDYPATVSDFVLDNFEVTVGRFRKFVEVYSPNMIPPGAGKNSRNPNDAGWDPALNAYLPADSLALIKIVTNSNKNPPYISWTDSIGGDDIEHRPINYLTWVVAQAFCIWDGGRLPTQAEWNYAAVGGSEQRKYPWGNNDPGQTTEFAIYNCLYNAGMNGYPRSYCHVAGLAPVGFAPKGNGKWGQSDLSGGLAEFMQDYALSSSGLTFQMPCVDCANLTPYTPTNLLSSKKLLFGPNYDFPYANIGSQVESFSISPVSSATQFYVGARCARNAP